MVDKILDKATELFMRNGFKIVTMDDIANTMGISKKTIYQHYENKNVLVESSAKKIVENIIAEIDEIYSELLNPIEEILLVRNKVAKFLSDEKAAGIQQLKKYYPEIHYKLKNRQDDKLLSCVSRNLERGIDLGLYRENLDVNFITKIYHNSMGFIMDTDEFHPTPLSFLDYQAKYIEYHIRGIGTEKGIKLLNELKQKLHEE